MARPADRPDVPFVAPPYAYVPGGPWPHPTRSHPAPSASASRVRSSEPPIPTEEPAGWRRSAAYLRGFALFNTGFYWEAHEAWEGLWHAHGRQGPTADVLRGLIKLAAVGVKVRERRPAGAATHARRAALLFAAVHNGAAAIPLGLDLEALTIVARQLADRPPPDPGRREDPVVRVFSFQIDPREPDDPRPCITPVDGGSQPGRASPSPTRPWNENRPPFRTSEGGPVG